METPILVAIIGGVVTIVGFVISGLFGVLASTSQREAAASAGVEKAMTERLAGKDDRIDFLEAKNRDLEQENAEYRTQNNELRLEVRDQARQLRQKAAEIHQCEQEKQRLVQAMSEENKNHD